jgi:hypothetical protein
VACRDNNLTTALDLDFATGLDMGLGVVADVRAGSSDFTLNNGVPCPCDDCRRDLHIAQGEKQVSRRYSYKKKASKRRKSRKKRRRNDQKRTTFFVCPASIHISLGPLSSTTPAEQVEGCKDYAQERNIDPGFSGKHGAKCLTCAPRNDSQPP